MARETIADSHHSQPDLQPKLPRAIPGGAVVTDPPARGGDARDAGSIPGLGRSPGVGKGSPLQYACLKNSTDRGAWWAAVHAVAKGQT